MDIGSVYLGGTLVSLLIFSAVMFDITRLTLIILALKNPRMIKSRAKYVHLGLVIPIAIVMTLVAFVEYSSYQLYTYSNLFDADPFNDYYYEQYNYYF